MMMRMMVMMDRYRRIHESEEDTATVTATAGPVPSLNNKSSDRTSTQEEEEEEEPRSVPVRPRDRKGQWDGSTTEKGKTKQQCRRIHNKHQDEYHYNYTTDGTHLCAPILREGGGKVPRIINQQQHLLHFHYHYH
mmetsp:Transcript_26247/g.28245  ORF Transcript_26247/g.28245 Transcript_26247/m.28245 type:complete len:135 (+) Transcript_26247:927-1331(+)